MILHRAFVDPSCSLNFSIAASCTFHLKTWQHYVTVNRYFVIRCCLSYPWKEVKLRVYGAKGTRGQWGKIRSRKFRNKSLSLDYSSTNTRRYYIMWYLLNDVGQRIMNRSLFQENRCSWNRGKLWFGPPWQFRKIEAGERDLVSKAAATGIRPCSEQSYREWGSQGITWWMVVPYIVLVNRWVHTDFCLFK